MSDPIFAAYRAGGVRHLYGAHFTDPEDRRAAVARATGRMSPAVADAIAAQNERYGTSPARAANIAALRGGAAAAVSGQQVGLFLGPLFTLYKAASAVRVARALSAESGAAVVPIFWLQCEDHDLVEIAESRVPRSDGTSTLLSLPASASDRTSLAHCLLPEAISDCLAQLTAELAHLPHAQEHLARLARHYRPAAGWTEAFAGALAEIFADQGLVLVNPRDPQLAQASAPIHRRALTRAAAISAALAARGQELEQLGGTPQVHVRAGAPLSFFHPGGVAGSRYRLVPADGGFAEAGGSGLHSAASLLEILEREPLRFSSSVLLRPIVQDSLLPTAAYIGGPAEVSYFAQIAALYPLFDVPMPLIVPRASFRLIDARSAQRLAELGLTPAAMAASESDLLQSAGSPPPLATEAIRRSLSAGFEDALAPLRSELEQSGPGVSVALEKTKATVELAIAKLIAKYESAYAHRDQQRVSDIRRLKQLLFPDDVPQERYFGLPYFAARYGERRLLEQVLAAIEPFRAEPIDLVLSDD